MKEITDEPALSQSMLCSIEAERRVLGAVLLGNLSFADLSEVRKVSCETFYDDRHRHIFEMIHQMLLQSQSIDLPMLCDWLRSGNQLDTAGGELYVRSLIDHTSSPEDAEQYIDIIRKKEFLRRIILVAKSTMLKCYNETTEIDLMLGEMEQDLMLFLRPSDPLNQYGKMP